jgi:uncharacterized protein (TIGR03437 family)
VSAFQTLIVEIEGDPGTTIQIGLKDATQPDDGTETKVTLPVTSNWTAYAIPLSSFATPVLAHGGYVLDFHKVYVPCEFVFAGGPQAQTVKVRTITYTTSPLIAGVSNAASGLAAIAPNTWVSIYGSSFTAAGFSDDWSKSIVNGNLPTTLDGVSVSVGGVPAYVSFVSSGQINILTPNVAPGSASVRVTTAIGTTTAPVTVTAQQFSPAFFRWPNGQPVATHLDYSWAVKNGTFAGATTVPAKPGEYIILWGTGFGPTTPTAPVGVAIPAGTAYYTANPVYVTIGSVNAAVYGTALASGFGGLYQVVALVPASLSNGNYALVATVGGVATATTTLTVQN